VCESHALPVKLPYELLTSSDERGNDEARNGCALVIFEQDFAALSVSLCCLQTSIGISLILMFGPMSLIVFAEMKPLEILSRFLYTATIYQLSRVIFYCQIYIGRKKANE
jgi:hypothetical protein